MTTVIEDLPRGDVKIAPSGTTARRYFLVQDPLGPASSKLYNAINDGQLPTKTDAHPVIPSLVATGLTASQVGNDPNRVLVEVQYNERTSETTSGEEDQSVQTIEVSIDTFSETTVRDASGAVMKIKYTGGTLVTEKVIETQVERPTATVRISRTESVPPKLLVSNNLVGSMNSVSWSGFPPKTWLFRGASSRQQPDGKSRVTYEFTHNPQTWRAQGTIIVGASIPNDITVENGIAFFDVYPSFDFARLGVFW